MYPELGRRSAGAEQRRRKDGVFYGLGAPFLVGARPVPYQELRADAFGDVAVLCQPVDNEPTSEASALDGPGQGQCSGWNCPWRVASPSYRCARRLPAGPLRFALILGELLPLQVFQLSSDASSWMSPMPATSGFIAKLPPESGTHQIRALLTCDLTSRSAWSSSRPSEGSWLRRCRCSPREHHDSESRPIRDL